MVVQDFVQSRCFVRFVFPRGDGAEIAAVVLSVQSLVDSMGRNASLGRVMEAARRKTIAEAPPIKALTTLHGISDIVRGCAGALQIGRPEATHRPADR